MPPPCLALQGLWSNRDTWSAALEAFSPAAREWQCAQSTAQHGSACSLLASRFSSGFSSLGSSFASTLRLEHLGTSLHCLRPGLGGWDFFQSFRLCQRLLRVCHLPRGCVLAMLSQFLISSLKVTLVTQKKLHHLARRRVRFQAERTALHCI